MRALLGQVERTCAAVPNAPPCTSCTRSAAGMSVNEFRGKYGEVTGVMSAAEPALAWFERDSEGLGIQLERTGSVGRVSGLGTHTTRHVSLVELPGAGYLADSPGFNKPTLDQVSAELLVSSCPFRSPCSTWPVLWIA